jgi:hypothetical protein
VLTIHFDQTLTAATQKALEQLPGTMHRKVMRSAVMKALVPVRRAAYVNAPRDQGLVKFSLRSISVARQVQVQPDGRVFGAVGPSVAAKRRNPNRKSGFEQAIYYAHMTEGGTRRGVAPQRWMQRAWFATRQQAGRLLEQGVRDGLRKEAQRLDRKLRAFR